jgi:hypothetical protein
VVIYCHIRPERSQLLMALMGRLLSKTSACSTSSIRHIHHNSKRISSLEIKYSLAPSHNILLSPSPNICADCCENKGDYTSFVLLIIVATKTNPSRTAPTILNTWTHNSNERKLLFPLPALELLKMPKDISQMERVNPKDLIRDRNPKNALSKKIVRAKGKNTFGVRVVFSEHYRLLTSVSWTRYRH